MLPIIKDSFLSNVFVCIQLPVYQYHLVSARWPTPNPCRVNLTMSKVDLNMFYWPSSEQGSRINLGMGISATNSAIVYLINSIESPEARARDLSEELILPFIFKSILEYTLIASIALLVSTLSVALIIPSPLALELFIP